MAIQDSINQMLGTAAAAAFAANKTIGQDLDAETNENVKFSNENLQETQAKEMQDVKTKIDALNSQEQQLSKQMLEKHPRNEKGQFISQMEHQQNVSKQLTEVNKDLEMARKAQDVINNKLATRVQLGKAVETRKTQLEAAQANTQRANERLAKVQKETSWLVGGKK